METARQETKPLVAAICGVKNSGKTTCVEQLISVLVKRGLKVAAIKHDGHDFQADVSGTDSFRMQQAGACGTAVFSENRVLVYKEKKTDLDDLLECFGECDVILVEGCKDSTLLKFEIVRQGISKEPVSNPEGRAGILTDIEDFSWEDTKILDLNNIEKLADIVENMRKGEK